LFLLRILFCHLIFAFTWGFGILARYGVLSRPDNLLIRGIIALWVVRRWMRYFIALDENSAPIKGGIPDLLTPETGSDPAAPAEDEVDEGFASSAAVWVAEESVSDCTCSAAPSFAPADSSTKPGLGDPSGGGRLGACGALFAFSLACARSLLFFSSAFKKTLIVVRRALLGLQSSAESGVCSQTGQDSGSDD
jgi:hypothetical protein